MPNMPRGLGAVRILQLYTQLDDGSASTNPDGTADTERQLREHRHAAEHAAAD